MELHFPVFFISYKKNTIYLSTHTHIYGITKRFVSDWPLCILCHDIVFVAAIRYLSTQSRVSPAGVKHAQTLDSITDEQGLAFNFPILL